MIWIIAKICIFMGLISVLLASKSAVLCAVIYTLAIFFFSLLVGKPVESLIFSNVLVFGLSYLYFWLLLRFEGSFLFWLVMVAGILILFL